MYKDLRTPPIVSSFLSCEKDFKTILKELFINSKHSGELKRLLVINEKDCLDNTTSEVYKQAADLSLSELYDKGYIKLTPKIMLSEHEEVKSYILLSFDNFVESDNPEFRDNTLSFDIICHTDTWELGDFRLRPLKIAGYIDGILNNAKLSGIGELQFMNCNELLLNNEFSGYTLVYQRVNGSDDRIPK